MDINEYKKTGVLKLDQEDMNDPGTMKAVQTLMDKAHDEWVIYVKSLAEEFQISDEFAMCIAYLRGRSRWTIELEDELIRMANCGEEPPNMNEWPPDFWKK